MRAWLEAHRADVVLVVLGVLGGLAGGLAFAYGLQAGVLYLGGITVVALILLRPVVLAVIALVGSFAVQRVGAASGAAGASGGISYADGLLLVAAVIAVPSMVVGPDLRRLRFALVGLAVYLATLLPSVVLDDSTRGWFEWAHRLVLVGGAVVVGAWIAREGLVRTALRLLAAVACAVSVLAVLDTVASGLEPASPLGLNKNFVGALLSLVVIVVVGAPRQLGLALAGRLALALALSAGLLATQSRGSMLAAAAGIVFVVAFQPRAQGRQARGLVLLVSLVLGGFAFLSVRADLGQSEADLNNNSIGVRRQVEERTLEIWRTSPVVGVGLKYFNSGEWGLLAQAPNVVVDNELAESGVLGLAGFVVLQAAMVQAGLRHRRGHPFAVVGAGCVFAAAAHGMVDIYWSAGVASLPFLVLGMALGSDPAPDQPPGREPKTRSSALAST